MRSAQLQATFFVTTIILYLGAGNVRAGSDPAQRPASMHQVSIQLPGSPDQVHGVPIALSNGGRGSGDLLEPQQLTIRTADGWTMTMTCRSTSVTVRRGKTSTVYVRRPLEPVRFLEAKADLLRTLSQLGIEPDPLMQNQVSSWTKDVPGNGEMPGLIPYDWKTGINTQFHGLVLSIRISPDPAHGWYYLLIFSAVTPDSLPGIAPATQPATQSAMRSIRAAAKLMGTAADFRGAEVRPPTNGMGEADLLRPQKLSLTFPDGQQITLAARSSNAVFFDGVAHGIYVRRPMKEVSFKEARTDMIETLASLNIKPDQTMRSAISGWPDDVTEQRRPAPSLRNYQASLRNQIHGANLTVRLCPDPHGGWYYLMIFSVRAH